MKGGTSKGRGIGRRAVLGGLGATGALSLLGCQENSGGPSPTPSPTPTGTPTNLPRGAPNATMLQNLALVLQLAREYRSASWLIRVESSIGLSGVLSGDSCRYIFTYPGALLEDYWNVNPEGQIRFTQNPHILRYDTGVNIAPALVLDSPAVIAASLSFGFDRCIRLSPGAEWRFLASYNSQAGTPTAQMRLLGDGSEVFGEVWVSPQTGALLLDDVLPKCR